MDKVLFKKVMSELTVYGIKPKKRSIQSVIRYMNQRFRFGFAEVDTQSDDYFTILRDMAADLVTIFLIQYLYGITDTDLYNAISVLLANYMIRRPEADCKDFELDEAMSKAASVINSLREEEDCHGKI